MRHALALFGRWSEMWTTPMILFGTFASVAVAVLSVELMSAFLTWEHDSGRLASIVLHTVAYAFVIMTSTIVAGAVFSAFREGHRRTLLIRAITSYFCLMLVFASMFYQAAFIGDFRDAENKYERYRADAHRHAPPTLYRDKRAFSGIEHRFWTGVDWSEADGAFHDGLRESLIPATPAQMQDVASSLTIEQAVRFIPSARYAVFADCLHFSVATMTTVGYGDIAPRSVAVRIAADAEAVCNTLLLIFGLGMIFGNWRPPRDAV